MMKSLRMTLYVALAFVAMLLWNDWQKEVPKTQPVQVSQTSTSTSTNSMLPPNTIEAANTQLPPPAAAVQTTQAAPNTKANLISVQTDVLDLKIDPSKGTLTDASLPLYPASKNEPHQPFVLLSTDPDNYYVIQSGLTDIPGLGNQPIPFAASQSSYTLQPGQNQLAVNLTWKSPQGFLITKTYTFTRGSYAIDVNYKIDNQSNSPWQGRFFMQTQRLGTQSGSDHLVGMHTFYGIAYSTPDKPYNKMKFTDLNQHPLDQTIQGGWLAFLQHYFLTAWIPDSHQNYYYYSQTNNQIYTAGLISQSLNVPAGAQMTTSSKLYIGPELAENLTTLSPHLSLTIDYGWLWIISVAIFWLMKHVYTFVGNWGWSIVIVTLMIKLLFYKLSETSYRSMAKMRGLQPKIESLKERFGDDKQAMHRATMELYKKEKVNPLGGCLPILVQIPVFIALYWVLVESVELRQAPFILWIHDLSSPDPYFILPIIMGITMFIQQRLSPAPADPMQAKVMMFLPVFFTVFFLSFPSGLVLYWVVNNTISILQQWYITRRFAEGAYKQKSKKPRKK